MLTIKELKSRNPHIGKIEEIIIRPEKINDPISISSALIDVNSGLEGDHYSKKGGNRMVTLIQKEHIDMVASIMGSGVSPSQLRRNIVVSGINLLAFQDASFQLGDDVILQGTGLCHPCSRMEKNLGEGGYNAMRGHGGITATVIRGGKIALGDSVRLSLVDSPKLVEQA